MTPGRPLTFWVLRTMWPRRTGSTFHGFCESTCEKNRTFQVKPADVPSQKTVNGAAGFPFDLVGGHMPPVHSGENPSPSLWCTHVVPVGDLSNRLHQLQDTWRECTMGDWDGFIMKFALFAQLTVGSAAQNANAFAGQRGLHRSPRDGAARGGSHLHEARWPDV